MIMMGNKKNALAAILGPDSKNVGVRSAEGAPEGDDLEMIAQELIEAVHAKNAAHVKHCLRAAFECLDAEPHVEGPHSPEE